MKTSNYAQTADLLPSILSGQLSLPEAAIAGQVFVNK